MNGSEDTRQGRQDGLAVMGVFLAGLAVLVSIVAVGYGLRAIDEADDKAVAAASPSTVVTLSEFAIDPEGISVATGGALEVRNAGQAAHNLTVKGTDVKTADLSAGESATLDVSSLEEGEYTVICSIPGHESSGMTATLTIGGEGTGTATGGGDHAMTADEMDKAMHDVAAAFPAKTEGVGAVDLQPKVLPDGTKQFDLTTSEVDWEVEPGKVVKAMAYNGIVPGPTIRVAVGDKLRVILHNELEESTVIHFHGIDVPNSMDGVPDITQAPVKPGETFTYEFVARRAMVGMYHSHHNAATQVTNGLLGAFYIGELPMPAGVPTPDVSTPMILNDAGTIGFSLNGKSFPATAPIVATQGQWIRVDYMNEGLQIHPMHLHGMPQLVFAKDGYPVSSPQLEDTVLVAPGERVSVLIHATELGTWAYHCHILTHAERETGMFGMVTALVVQ